MQQYNIKFPYFEGLLRSALANVSDKLNDTLMIVLKLIKILHGNQ